MGTWQCFCREMDESYFALQTGGFTLRICSYTWLSTWDHELLFKLACCPCHHLSAHIGLIYLCCLAIGFNLFLKSSNVSHVKKLLKLQFSGTSVSKQKSKKSNNRKSCTVRPHFSSIQSWWENLLKSPLNVFGGFFFSLCEISSHFYSPPAGIALRNLMFLKHWHSGDSKGGRFHIRISQAVRSNWNWLSPWLKVGISRQWAQLWNESEFANRVENL